MGATSTRAAAYDVVVVGGGMVGALCACALGGSGLKVALLARRTDPAPATAQRVSAITPASRTMLEALGAWAGIGARRHGTVRAMCVWDDAGGAIHFDAADIGEPYLFYIVENAAIVAGLHARLQEFTNVHLLATDVVDIVLTDGIGRTTLADGRTVAARLLVGADGFDSAVRRAAGIALRRIDLAQRSIVATVATEHPHRATAYQRFLPTGPLALLPLAEPNCCSIVWSADDARAAALLALDDADFAAELRRALDNRLGAIQSVRGRAAFPLALSHAVDYVAAGVALVGDAAHTVHPLAGQGVNLGFLDAATLAEVVRDAAAAQKDIGALHVLRRYQRWRKGQNLGMVAATGAFKYLYGNDWPLVRELRNLGLTVTDRMPPVKRLIMRRASGLTGDLPRLARRLQNL